MKYLILSFILISCTPKIGPTLPDVDDRPGKPRYESNTYKISPVPNTYDTLNVNGIVYLVEKENG